MAWSSTNEWYALYYAIMLSTFINLILLLTHELMLFFNTSRWNFDYIYLLIPKRISSVSQPVIFLYCLFFAGRRKADFRHKVEYMLWTGCRSMAGHFLNHNGHVERPLRTCSDNLVVLSHDHNKIIMHLGMYSTFNTVMKRMLKSESSLKNSNATTKLPCRGLEQKNNDLQ